MMRTVIMILLLNGSVRCTQPEKTETQAIKQIVNGIIDSDNKGATEEVLNYYSKEAVLMPPGKPSISGKEAIRNNYEQIFTTSNLDMKIDIEEMRESDNWAVCIGRTYGTVTMKSDSPEKQVDDKYIMMLEKKNSEWKINRLIWN